MLGQPQDQDEPQIAVLEQLTSHQADDDDEDDKAAEEVRQYHVRICGMPAA